MAALLGKSRQNVEEFNLLTVPRSVEREVLALLQNSAGHPLSLREIRRELLSQFSELNIQKGILGLLAMELIEAVYTSGFELGFVLSSKTKEH